MKELLSLVQLGQRPDKEVRLAACGPARPRQIGVRACTLPLMRGIAFETMVEVKETVIPLYREIRSWFLIRREYLVAFADADSRLEGWFKAELLLLLGKMKKQGRLDGFEREVNPIPPGQGRRKQVDFQIEVRGTEHLCELKALCISQAGGTPRDLNFYFRNDYLGLLTDFRKLDTLQATHKWVLAFVYPRPARPAWAKAAASLPKSLQHWRCLTRPEDFPEFLFIAVWSDRRQ